MRARRRGAVLGWGLLGFACLQLGLALLLEHHGPEFRDPEYGLKLRCLRQRLAEHPNRPLLLMLGSSRPAVGFRPGVLPPAGDDPDSDPLVFNFALISSGPVLELLCLQRLLDDGIRPDFILVECWPLMWEGRGGKFVEGVRLQTGRLGLLDLRRLWPFAGDRRRLLRVWGSVPLAPALLPLRALPPPLPPHPPS